MAEHPLAHILEALDTLDGELLELLNERAALAQQLSALAVSESTTLPAFPPARMVARNRGPLPAATIGLLFRELDSACRALDRPLTIACLGPTGTFSEQAARQHFGHAVTVELTSSIDEVFRTVEAGGADFGVVPVENSTEGAVGRSLDLLAATPRTLSGEILVRIRHQLLGKQADLSRITRVFSHAQSLGQCHGWLNAHLPHVERVPVSSNAEAARRAAETEDAAAIAGEQAAAPYGLTLIARDIQDDPDNTTRFVVLGSASAPSSGSDRTSLVVSARNEPGAVHHLLAPLAARRVSMTRFESRPSKLALWEYLFFVDLEGHRDDAHVAAALAEVTALAGYVKILGSYPKAVSP